MINLSEATRLRKIGKTYKEISTALICSIDWCKRNLKSVKQDVIINPNKKCDLSRLLENSDESFYWLGFLMADGHFSNGSRIKITIAAKDETHLLKLKNFLSIENLNRCVIKGNYYVGITGMDTKVVKELVDMFQIKSSKTEFPCRIDHINERQLFCLSIGFIDGDGCIDKQYKRIHSRLRIKCHKSWLENLLLMFPEAQTKLNKQGYATASITDTTLLREIKLTALNYNLPFMTRKWDNIDTNFVSREFKSKGETVCQIHS